MSLKLSHPTCAELLTTYLCNELQHKLLLTNTSPPQPHHITPFFFFSLFFSSHLNFLCDLNIQIWLLFRVSFFFFYFLTIKLNEYTIMLFIHLQSFNFKVLFPLLDVLTIDYDHCSAQYCVWFPLTSIP